MKFSSLLSIFGDRIRLNSLLIVLCFVSVLLLESQSAASFPTYLLSIAVVATFRAWNDVFQVSLAWLILVLLAYLVMSVAWSEPVATREFWSFLGKALLIWLFIVAFAECQLRGELQLWLGRSMAVVGSCAAGAAIVVWATTNPADGRLNGLGQLDTHVVAALIFGVALLFVVDSLLRESSFAWKGFFCLAGCTLVAAVALSDSRNAWVSLVIGLGVFLVARYADRAKEFVVGVVALSLLLVLGLLVLYLEESAVEFVLPRGDSFRPAIWGGILDKLSEVNWLFGAGIAAIDDVVVDGIVFQHAHNMYLSVLYQGGVIGVVLFLCLIAACIAVLLRDFQSPDAKLALGILALSLSSYLLDGHELIDRIGETWFLFWLPVAICLGLQWRTRYAPE